MAQHPYNLYPGGFWPPYWTQPTNHNAVMPPMTWPEWDMSQDPPPTSAKQQPKTASPRMPRTPKPVEPDSSSGQNASLLLNRQIPATANSEHNDRESLLKEFMADATQSLARKPELSQRSTDGEEQSTSQLMSLTERQVEKIKFLEDQIKSMKEGIQASEEESRRLRDAVESLKDLVQSLKEQIAQSFLALDKHLESGKKPRSGGLEAAERHAKRQRS